jgi:hypothetical protein
MDGYGNGNNRDEDLLEQRAIFMHRASLKEYLAGDDWAMLLLPQAMSGRS